MTTQDQLTAMLDALEAALPAMIEDNPDPGDFWATFAGAAEVIEDRAGEHAPQVFERITNMLAKHGRYIATIDEGGRE